MANALCFTLVSSFNSNSKPGLLNGSSNARKFFRVDDLFGKSRTAKFQSVQPKAADSSKSSKPSSIVCVDCDGNGAVLCSQCQGSGVNSVDHFNGQFKAGGLCWLCRGKRDVLCGSCNGAGFLGGFMSTFDE
ncbi:protein BUNDLE SHEATH DEFECTIVE 2, chloroplastic isoform X2 [Macadamia integrifolia]|uniref:protein BUNDLE SHEATH DEFECTIVE 2, chloroplastic isoform X2 n=1 Tax=Macadamia integrifolia TaxID=60698 RepID=UPI001C4FF64D|nr:protein BUNDLE SHEATH DEFECTIVE 2, chloroplastic isoform X2 [Macadamia integrifolia]